LVPFTTMVSPCCGFCHCFTLPQFGTCYTRLPVGSHTHGLPLPTVTTLPPLPDVYHGCGLRCVPGYLLRTHTTMPGDTPHTHRCAHAAAHLHAAARCLHTLPHLHHTYPALLQDALLHRPTRLPRSSHHLARYSLPLSSARHRRSALLPQHHHAALHTAHLPRLHSRARRMGWHIA